MTTSNATGWYSDGEVEDYFVVSSAPILSLKHLDFNAWADRKNHVQLNWQAFTDVESNGFEIQRSTDQLNWQKIGWKDMNASGTSYSFCDAKTVEGMSWYRVKLVEQNHSFQYSNAKQVFLLSAENEFKITPNPVTDNGILHFSSASANKGELITRTLFGKISQTRSIEIKPGVNEVHLDLSLLKHGIYIIELKTANKIFISKIIKL
jgi:hypothetical protein